MPKLSWDAVGERFYETGVEQGVLFVYDNNAYGAGVAWNGLTSVSENPSGAETTTLWADDIKYLNMISAEDYAATIEAYTRPDEFAACDGTASITDGVYVTQQPRKTFGFSYVTKIGNDTDGTNKGYKIHLVYGCTAAPSSKDYNTINDSPEAMTLSWEVSTTPIAVPGYKPTAHIIIDSTKVDSTKLGTFKDILYGTDGTSGSEGTTSRLPLPTEVISHFTGQTVQG